MCAKLAILWHMHQPCYLDPSTGGYLMPWVFLHAAKDYREMLDLAVKKNARVTFNFVPILLDQLKDYGDKNVNDPFLRALRKDPSLLSPEEKILLAEQLSMLHPENQARRFGRLYDLVMRLTRRHRAGEGDTPSFTRGEWLDLSVLYLVAWTGEETRARSPFITALAHRGEGFSQEDKLQLVDELQEVCAQTEKAFRDESEAGHIEVSTTPYCHPILPLLLDIQSAREAVPSIVLPPVEDKTFGDDAATQVNQAVARHTQAFGSPPKGFWPSEGSVSSEALELLVKTGATWAATDEDILAASLGRSLTGPGRRDLYRPHRFSTPSGDINLFFRDKALSDLIGFVYASWPAKSAAADFVERLKAISHAHGEDSVISVILDGENAWEHYAENGAPFLRELYSAVNSSGEITFATFSELASPNAPELPKIRAGSWIYGSFTTWIGHPEKNRAWELLAATRKRVSEVYPALSEERRAKVWEHMRIAEGSDWFWWLGDDHYTPLAGRFDELFRGRLMAVHRELGEEAPSVLRSPIKRIGRRGLVSPPKDQIKPDVDGVCGSFFKWYDAGVFDLTFDAGSMHRVDSAFDTLLFGCDDDSLYLCLKSRGLLALLSEGCVLEVLDGPEEKKLLTLSTESVKGVVGGQGAIGEVVEIGLPLSALTRDGENRVNMAFKLIRNGELIERAPLLSLAEFVPEADRSLGGWSV